MSDRNFLLKIAIYSVGITFPMWFLLAVRWPISGDYTFHSLILNNVSQQIWSGDWYPRWLPDTNAGLGSPVFIFSPPSVYFVGALLQWLAPVDPYGFGRLFLVASFFIFIGGLACYAWLREYFDRKSAHYGTTLYITFPITFFLLYLSFAIPSLSGIMVFPLLLMGATKLAANPLRYGWYYALAQGILTFTHLPSTLMFSGIGWLYAIVIAPPGKRLNVFCCVSTAAALGIMLASMCWVPLWFNTLNVLYDLAFTGGLDYNSNFISLFAADKTDVGRNLGGMLRPLIIVVPTFFCLLNIRNKKPLENNKIQVYFWGAVLACIIFMMFPFSKPLWDIIPLLHYIMFPTRLGMIAFPAIVFLMTNWLPKLENASIYFVLSIILGTSIFVLSANENYSQTLNPAQKNVLSHQLMPWAHYTTIWMSKAGISDPASPPVRFLSVPLYKSVMGDAQLSGITQTSRSFSFHAHVASPTALVTLRRYFYPGWIVPDTMPKGVVIAEHDALLAVTLPMGDYDVQIKQPWFPGEKVGDLLSAVGLVILLLWIFSVRILFPGNKNAAIIGG